jgi:hypothetical protein
VKKVSDNIVTDGEAFKLLAATKKAGRPPTLLRQVQDLCFFANQVFSLGERRDRLKPKWRAIESIAFEKQ